MSLLSCAGGAAVWRGYEYYLEHRVTSVESLSETEYKAQVRGEAKRPYETKIDISHPKRSSCDCPHAAGRRIICKHMVALFFTAFPDEAETYRKETDAYEEEQAELRTQNEEAILKYIKSLKKEQLQQTLLELLHTGPDWQWDRFIREKLGR